MAEAVLKYMPMKSPCVLYLGPRFYNQSQKSCGSVWVADPGQLPQRRGGEGIFICKHEATEGEARRRLLPALSISPTVVLKCKLSLTEVAGAPRSEWVAASEVEPGNMSGSLECWNSVCRSVLRASLGVPSYLCTTDRPLACTRPACVCIWYL